jgi:hypothetical protein
MEINWIGINYQRTNVYLLPYKECLEDMLYI